MLRFMISFILILILTGLAYGAEYDELVKFVGNVSVMDLVGLKAVETARDLLEFKELLVITNAGYCKIGEYTTEKALNGLMIGAKVSRGKGNLVNVFSHYNAPLWFAFFDKKSKDCVYLEVNSTTLKKYLEMEKENRTKALQEFMNLDPTDLFVRIAKENIDAEKLLTDPESWQKKMVEKVFGGNEFRIVTIANVWAKGVPNDFMRIVEVHDHVCPGLISGYMIAKYLSDVFPSQNPRKEYVIIAVPPWCKDDAFIVLFGTTPGHKNMFVKWLTPEQKAMLPDKAKNVANIVIKRDMKTGELKGIVVGFNWSKAMKMGGVKWEDFKSFDTYKWWWARLKLNLLLIDYLDKYEMFVYTIKTFSLKPEELEKFKSAGVNPLVELGIMQSNVEKEETPGFTAILALIAIIIVIARVKRNK